MLLNTSQYPTEHTFSKTSHILYICPSLYPSSSVSFFPIYHSYHSYCQFVYHWIPCSLSLSFLNYLNRSSHAQVGHQINYHKSMRKWPHSLNIFFFFFSNRGTNISASSLFQCAVMSSILHSHGMALSQLLAFNHFVIQLDDAEGQNNKIATSYMMNIEQGTICSFNEPLNCM